MLLTELGKMIFKNPKVLRKLRVMSPDEERYVRPQRQYEIPSFGTSMKHCTSNGKYLKPTRWCNPREPEVVAMAHELGAYRLSDYAFAESAYWFIKTKMAFELCPFDGAGATLKRGTGTCYHLINVFVALCRSAGIRAQYKSFSTRLRGPERDFLAVDQTIRKLFDMAGGIITEGEGEACIDGTWVVAYLGQNAAASACPGWPITQFGEDAIGMYFEALPGTIRRFESLPLRPALIVKALQLLAPASMERMNAAVHRALAVGWQEIHAAGGIEAYNRIARRKREIFSLQELLSAQSLKHYDKIVIKRT